MAEYVNIHTHRPAGRGIELRAKGVHPWDAEREDTATLGQRLGDAQAVGETGLDFACGVAREAQTAALRAQLRLARERGLPVVLHCVRAFEPLMRELAACPPPAAIFHGFIGSPEQARQAVRMARDAGFDNLNLDLMLGLPGQKPEQWEQTLEKAMALAPEHLSCYGLILEEGTPLFRQVEAGTCAPLPDEDALCEMDDITERLTQAGGYARYEVSNYAKAGKMCRHNIVYWECLPYLGIGCAAHSDMDGKRFYNAEDFDAYLNHAPAQMEDAGGRMFERMMMGLRMVRGVDERRFIRDFGCAPAMGISGSPGWEGKVPH